MKKGLDRIMITIDPEKMSTIPETLDIVYLGMPEWHAKAKCRDPRYDPDDWFPADSGEQWKAARARSVCIRCPVWKACLVSALRDPADQYGIRGGWTPRQRKYFRRVRRVPQGLPSPLKSGASPAQPRTASGIPRDASAQELT